MKKYLISFLIFFSLVISISGLYFLSNAQEDIPERCDITNNSYMKSAKFLGINIGGTVDNFITGAALSAFLNSTGGDVNTVMGCEEYLSDKLGIPLGEKLYVVPEVDTRCHATTNDICEAFVTDYSATPSDNVYSGDNMASADVKAIRSSLLGLANLAEGFARHEPLPVNMAYFWNQSISKIPFVNKALAAPMTDAYNNLPIIKISFFAWQFSRNIALALMSIILLYTGIMIIMRKKVNPQLVVSVQYAIPKILVGFILILFSYAIGALIAAVSWGLFRGGYSLVFKAFFSSTGSSMAAAFPTTGAVIILVIITMLSLASGSWFYVFVIVGVAVAVLILHLVLYFKAFLIYLKMVFSIITAPLEIALGTVPGSEDRIKDWFLRMAKYGITIFAMGVIIPVTLVMALSVLLAYKTGASAEMGGWGILISIVAPIIIVIFGFSIAISIDKKIDTAFFGGGKKKK